ncbi:MAG: arginine N-succinyltransferase [Oceanospirillaceae bacterium]|nr:arginine N-succinyltransferase [Oceanospirillaceae bacterium]
MLFIRPSKLSDLNALLALSEQVGDGMTSMPTCKASWERKLLSSEQAFNSPKAPAQSCYFMVLEDSITAKIVGTTAIYTGLGLTQPFYSYQRTVETSQSSSLKTTHRSETLSLVEHFKGATEVGSLFLLPQYRLPGVGQMLARARYLLMADARERFSSQIMAELRGVVNEDNQSPLWEALGSKFFDMDFQQAVNVAATQGSTFITELMPKHPIYVELLAKSARNTLSVPNTNSAPALRMLEKEGFEHRGIIDLFDGGPTVEAVLDDIKTIKQSQLVEIKQDQSLSNKHDEYYISNTCLKDFRLIKSRARLTQSGQLLLDSQSIQQLNLKAEHSLVRIVSVMKSKQANAGSQAA